MQQVLENVERIFCCNSNQPSTTSLWVTFQECFQMLTSDPPKGSNHEAITINFEKKISS